MQDGRNKDGSKSVLISCQLAVTRILLKGGISTWKFLLYVCKALALETISGELRGQLLRKFHQFNGSTLAMNYYWIPANNYL